MKETLQNLKIFFEKKENLLWFISTFILNNFYFVIMMWTPYYISVIGFDEASSTVSLMYPLMSCFSSITINYSFTYCTRKASYFVLLFFFLSIILEVVLLTLGEDQSDLIWYFICFGGIGLFTAPGLSCYEAAALT